MRAGPAVGRVFRSKNKKFAMRFIPKINLKGELFSSTFTYGLSILTKFGSSVILTRVLDPSAYGMIGILFSIAFMIELLSDVGATGLLIRTPRGEEKLFVHTVWSIRLVRSLINFTLLYMAAPLIAQVYKVPELTDALRLMAFYFPLSGMESLSFILAQRHQRSRIGNYVDLATSIVSTLFVIAIAPLIRDYRVFIYGFLLQRMMALVISHLYYREIGVGLAFDREAAREQFGFAKFVMPSSLLTIVLSQYDKVIFLRLFDLSLLGIYGLAGNMIGPVGSLIVHNCRVILYPRCSAYFRSSPETAKDRYYAENTKLFSIVTIPPAVVAGLSGTIVALMYDARYRDAGFILMVMGANAVFGSIQNTSENLIVAAGHTRAVLHGNLARLVTLVPTTLLGFYFFGFKGFVWAALVNGVLVAAYYLRMQHQLKLLDLKFEAQRVFVAAVFFFVCLGLSSLIAPHIPPDFVRHLLHMKSHEAP